MRIRVKLFFTRRRETRNKTNKPLSSPTNLEPVQSAHSQRLQPLAGGIQRPALLLNLGAVGVLLCHEALALGLERAGPLGLGDDVGL